MIKVIIERHIKGSESLSPMLRQLRTAAMQQPGYVSGETLVSTEDSSSVVVISTWHSLDDWKAWETSEARAKLYQQVRPLLDEEPRVRTYKVMATEEKTG